VRPSLVVFVSTFAIALLGVIRATIWRPAKARKPKPA
jgi:hypothetical protein